MSDIVKNILPYDITRCQPKWPYPRCKECARHLGRFYNQNLDYEKLKISVTDFSQDTKGDQLQECGAYIEE